MGMPKALFKWRHKRDFFTRDLVREKNCEFGPYTYGKPVILQYGEGSKLKVGKFCSIAAEVKILLGGNHRTDWITTSPVPALAEDWPEAKDIEGHPLSKGDVLIGNDVWIGYGATILSGVRIGDGAAIAARSVVVRDVEPYAVVAGNPAAAIGKRFDDRVVEMLLGLRWWDWPPEKIRRHLGLLCSERVEDLLKVGPD